MIDRLRTHLGLHPCGHETLGVRHDHAILLGYQEPAWTILPKRSTHLDADAGNRNRPLNGRQQGLLFGRTMLGESVGKGRVGKPDQAMAVRRELGCLRMRLGAVEHVGDRFSPSSGASAAM